MNYKSVNKNYLVLVDEKSREKVTLNNGKEIYRSNQYGTNFDRMPYWGTIHTDFKGSNLKKGDEVGFFHMVLKKKKTIKGNTFFSATEQDVICKLPDMEANSIWIKIEHIKEKHKSSLAIKDLVSEQRVKVTSSNSPIAKEGDIIHIPRNADYIFNYKEKDYYFCRENRVIYNETTDTLLNEFVLVEPLDEGDMYELVGGIYMPIKETVEKGRAKVFMSNNDELNKGDIVYCKKSDSTSVDLKEKKYYGVKEIDINVVL